MKQMMTLTANAVSRLQALQSKGLLKVGVKKGGCAGMEYSFETCETPAKFDAVVEQDGVKLVIDAKAILYLIGSQMDYKTDKFTSTFVFENPNQTSSCGCGESVELKPAALLND